ALYREETSHRDGELDALIESYREFEAGRLRIVTSAITLAEVVKTYMGAENYETLSNLRFADNFRFISVNPAILDLAAEIRDYYHNNPLPSAVGLNVGMGDAIHLASAVAQDVDVFVTLDQRNKRKKGELGMVQLSGNVAGRHPLHIRRPIPPA